MNLRFSSSLFKRENVLSVFVSLLIAFKSFRVFFVVAAADKHVIKKKTDIEKKYVGDNNK